MQKNDPKTAKTAKEGVFPPIILAIVTKFKTTNLQPVKATSSQKKGFPKLKHTKKPF